MSHFDFQNQNGKMVTLISIEKVGGDVDLVRKKEGEGGQVKNFCELVSFLERPPL
jgi:hypothetical protein